jgi:hypothetical protein
MIVQVEHLIPVLTVCTADNRNRPVIEHVVPKLEVRQDNARGWKDEFQSSTVRPSRKMSGIPEIRSRTGLAIILEPLSHRRGMPRRGWNTSPETLGHPLVRSSELDPGMSPVRAHSADSLPCGPSRSGLDAPDPRHAHPLSIMRLPNDFGFNPRGRLEQPAKMEGT